MHRAMDMFSDLRQFGEAKTWADEWERTKDSQPLSLLAGGASPGPAGPASQSLVQRQAEWNEEMKDFQAAADMYLQVLVPSAASALRLMPCPHVESYHACRSAATDAHLTDTLHQHCPNYCRSSPHQTLSHCPTVLG